MPEKITYKKIKEIEVSKLLRELNASKSPLKNKVNVISIIRDGTTHKLKLQVGVDHYNQDEVKTVLTKNYKIKSEDIEWQECTRIKPLSAQATMVTAQQGISKDVKQERVKGSGGFFVRQNNKFRLFSAAHVLGKKGSKVWVGEIGEKQGVGKVIFSDTSLDIGILELPGDLPEGVALYRASIVKSKPGAPVSLVGMMSAKQEGQIIGESLNALETSGLIETEDGQIIQCDNLIPLRISSQSGDSGAPVFMDDASRSFKLIGLIVGKGSNEVHYCSNLFRAKKLIPEIFIGPKQINCRITNDVTTGKKITVTRNTRKTIGQWKEAH